MNLKIKNIFLVILLFYVPFIYGQTSSEPSNEYHSRAMTNLKAGKTAEAETLFYNSAREFSYAPSWYELAKIEFDKNTVYSRGKARDYIDKAIWADPKNIDYRMLKAKLMEFFSSSMAYDVYEDILQLDPDNTEALFNMGKIKEEDFYEYHNSFMKYEDASLSYNDYAYKAFIDAEGFFKKAIRSDPARTDSYIHLSHLYSEAGKYKPGIPLLKEVVKIDPQNQNAFLFLGYLYYKTLSFDSSQTAYQNALESDD